MHAYNELSARGEVSANVSTHGVWCSIFGTKVWLSIVSEYDGPNRLTADVSDSFDAQTCR
jgi:hypothetical protein